MPVKSGFGTSLRNDLGALAEILSYLTGPLPGVAHPEPVLRDRTPDPGLFGPQSVTWRVSREPVLLLGGGQLALLMQVADPLIAQAVLEHSAYATDPHGRLMRTLRWLLCVTFGTQAEAEAATRELAARHRPIQGVLPQKNASPPYPAGVRYDAGDPELSRWVLATLMYATLATYQALVGRLSVPERDGFVREWAAVAALFSLPPEPCCSSAAALDAYIMGRIAAFGPELGPGSRQVGLAVLHPAATAAIRPLFGGPRFLATGLLAPELRRGYGLGWSALHQRSFEATCASIRQAVRVFPRRLRVSPFYEQALSRVQSASA